MLNPEELAERRVALVPEYKYLHDRRSLAKVEHCHRDQAVRLPCRRCQLLEGLRAQMVMLARNFSREAES